jgi:hypothetical protein
MVKKNLQSKKVAVFSSNNLSIVAAWLKPGDKLKYDDTDMKDYYLDKFGDIPYKHVWYNGTEGYIISEALSL